MWLRGLALFVSLVFWAPGPASAQQAGLPTIGFLSGAASGPFAHLVAAFGEGLASMGYVDGRNVRIEFRWADGEYERLPKLAAELVALDVDVIVTSGGDRPTIAAKDATAEIPIVFVGSDAPVALGFVESLNQPGRNLTGGSVFTSEVEVKKLELLYETAPTASTIAMLVNPNNPMAETDTLAIAEAAQSMGLEIEVHHATDAASIEAALSAIADKRPDALLVGHDPYFNSQRQQIVALVDPLGIPAIYEHRAFVQAGGLMSYGNIIDDNYRIAGEYAGRILSGATPAELPVRQATRFELMINLATAERIGLDIPASVLIRADEILE